jgi:hypothetical protein
MSSLLWILLSVALAGSLGIFLAAPFGEVAGAEGTHVAASGQDVYGRLLDSKERALRALKDLELDFTMGKVSPDDFERSKRELSQEVAQILEEIRRHG